MKVNILWVFENIVLRREEVTKGWKKSHYEELRNLDSSPDVIRVIKSRRIRLAGRDEEHIYNFGWNIRSKQIIPWKIKNNIKKWS
jgi:hypothetical protein